MNLYELSKTILSLNKAPINKVRFARVIYFVHKELIRKKFMSPEDIAYIRSPLGPIPEGLLRLTLEHPNITAHPALGPSFAAEEYTINLSDADETEETLMLEQYRDILKATERTLKALSAYTTPELVEASHADPSWINNFNGVHFFITPADLKNPFPFTTIRIKIRVKPAPSEISALQANLLRGMMRDIVKESTDLEYPDQASTQTNSASRTNPAISRAKPSTASKTTPKLNPLDVLSILPFLRHQKTAKNAPKTSQKSPKATKPSTKSTARPQKPTSSAPKTEQNPNKRGKRGQQGTTFPLSSDAGHSEAPASDKPHEGTK